MPNAFLQLAEKDRKAILEKAAQDLGKGANVLEKDVWVCWTLEVLVTMPNVPPLAFKGGTSLSKAYDAITRFSEDVDVTLDRRVLNPGINPLEAQSSKERNDARDALTKALGNYTEKIIKPYFDECLQSELSDKKAAAHLGDIAGELYIPYPSSLDTTGSYMKESVLLELGGRNEITPADTRQLQPYLASVVDSVGFPRPFVSVLAAERTFWEKATLIHAECNRDTPKESVKKLSRHWYDLAQLARSPIGDSALHDGDLMKAVVEQKQVLYYSKQAKYPECLVGKFRLIPPAELIGKLKDDFAQMEMDAMFWEAPGSFDNILSELAELEAMINGRYGVKE